MSDDAMIQEFLATAGQGRRRKDKAPAGLRQVSEKQAIRNAFLAGVKAERIHQRGKTCEGCLTRLAGDLHHTERRSKSKGYDGRAPGVDAPSNLRLLCRSCHRKEHP